MAVHTTLVLALKGRCRPGRSGFGSSALCERENVPRTGRSRPQGTSCGVFGLDVGGRWSEEAKIFIRLLGHVLAPNPGCFRDVWSRLGDCVGMQESLALWRDRLLLLCWAGGVVRGLMVKCPFTRGGAGLRGGPQSMRA